METLRLEHVYKVFKGKRKEGDVIAVKDFNLSIEDNEFLVFVGPSGCGKSTTLRMIAGLEDLSYGNIYIDGQLVNKIEPNYRNIAMVFQNYALYPHMTAYDNMAFGLKNRKVPKKEIDERIHEVAKILDIEELLNRKPKAMSGGQRQRVALGRAIVRTPKIFLLDEPLSNLDAKLRSSMRVEINKLYEKLKITFIYVTHDQVEAMTMGSRIVVMKKGVAQQIDTPSNLFDYPRNRFVAGFLGTPQMNFYEGLLKKEGSKISFSFKDNKLVLDPKELRLIDNTYLDGEEHKVILGIRPDDVVISPKGNLKAKVHIVETLGSSSLIYADFNLNEETSIKDSETALVINEQGRSNHVLGEEISVSFKPNKIHLFKDEENNEISIMIPPRSKRDEIVGYMNVLNDELKIKTEEGVVINLKEDLSKVNDVFKEGIHRVKLRFNDSIKLSKVESDIKLKYLGKGLLDDKMAYSFSLINTNYEDAFYESNLHIYLDSKAIPKGLKLIINNEYDATIDLNKLEIIGDDKLSIFNLDKKETSLDYYKFVEEKESKIDLNVKKTKEEIGTEIASKIIERKEEKDNLTLGLATGSSPLPLYDSLIKESKIKGISWVNNKTFNLDEYVGLDKDNDQSYRYFMNENLFKYLDFKEENHYFPSSELLEKYDDLIDENGGVDIQILGIGANGHIAFNEPKTSIDSKTHVTKLTKRTIKDNSRFFKDIKDVPTEAITMGLSTILKSKEIYLIATGKNKAKAISKILEGKYNPNYPASALNLASCKVHLYLDEECYKNLDQKALSKFELAKIENKTK